MKQIFCILMLWFPFLGYSQLNSNKSPTDSFMVIGVSKGHNIGWDNSKDVCLKNPLITFPENSTLLVSGIKNCYYDGTKYYVVIYNLKQYLIQKEELKVSDTSSFSRIEKMDLKQTERFNDSAWYFAKMFFEIDKRKALKTLDGFASSGISVLKWDLFDQSEYTDGVSVNIKVFNPTKKTIKYIWFTFVGYNPVGDKIIDIKRGASSIIMKAVGPLNSDESGTYEFKYVWFTDLVKTAKLTNIRIQYMDGSFKDVTNPLAVTLSKKNYNLIFEDTYE